MNRRRRNKARKRRGNPWLWRVVGDVKWNNPRKRKWKQEKMKEKRRNMPIDPLVEFWNFVLSRW